MIDIGDISKYYVVFNYTWDKDKKLIYFRVLNKGILKVIELEYGDTEYFNELFSKYKSYENKEQFYDLLTPLQPLDRIILEVINSTNTDTEFKDIILKATEIKQQRKQKKKEKTMNRAKAASERQAKQILSFEGLTADEFIKKKTIKPKISIGREIDNYNTETFDFIRIEIPITINSKSDRLKYCKIFKKELLEYAMLTLEQSKRFQRFGIPINFLKIDDIVLRTDCILEIIMSLK